MDSEPTQTKFESIKFLEYQSEGEEIMPGIKLRKDGRYEVRKMQEGRRISIYTKTLNEAKKILTKLKNNKIKISKEVKKQKVYTLKQWYEIWLDTYKKPFLKPKSYEMIISSFRKAIKKFGNIPINKISSLDIQKFLNSMELNRTKERIQVYFNAILQKACDLDLITKNPFKAVERTKKRKYKNFCYNFDEQQKIINAIKGTKIEQAIYCYLLTGARPNELPQKKDFDFTNNIINIHGTKNEKSKHREIQMSQTFAKYMEEYFLLNEFPGHTEIQQTFKNICEKLKIEKPLLYRLRHTFASNHFVLRTPAKQVSEWMGHTTISTTLDIYTDIDKTATKEKIQNLYNNFYYITNNG